MEKFRYIDDVEEWLEPMDYSGFWYAIAPYNLELQPRDHCDEQIASGVVDLDTVLDVLKYMARLELKEKLGLEMRMPTPWVKLVESH
jgi:hypothetical protein